MSHVVKSVENAITNPVSLVGDTFGFGIGGAGGLTGGTLAGNAITGQPLGAGLQGAAGTDLLGLGGGMALSGSLGAGLGMMGRGAGMVGAGDGTGQSGSNPFMNFLTGQGGGPSLPSLGPGLAALNYARQQTPIDTSQLQGVFNAAGANAPLFTQAAQAPLQQAQAGGYGDLLQSQANRGIRGSSFGDQSIANYMNTTNQGIANAGTNAAQAALGLQGQLGGQISNLNALSQQMKNDMYGRAFSSLGQGLNPTPGMGGGGTPFPTAGTTGSGIFGNLGLGGIGSAFGNGLGSIGSGLGNLFGSGSMPNWLWGTGATQGLGNSGLDSITNSGDFGLAGF